MSNPTIQQVAVIGAGVMGAQIAAHIANAGVPVLLLDIVPAGAKSRNQLAEAALEKLSKMEPAPLMSGAAARRIVAGNLEDDLGKLAEVDWIIEAVIENPAIKRDLYKKIDGVRKAGSIVSSNTSTIPLADLLKGQSAQFAADFLIAHFFNPVRYMRLLELVSGPTTRAAATRTIHEFCDVVLGKGVVVCHDQPGFIGNRLGIYFVQNALGKALELRLSVEEVDAVASAPMGIPKTGVFGFLDLVGLDLMPHIAKSFLATLPDDDDYRRIYYQPALLDKMMADGYIGRKGKGGFYRLSEKDGKKTKEAIDLQTWEYSPAKKVKLPTLEAAGKDLRKLCETDDKYGQFAKGVLLDTLAYAASLVPTIAADILAVDQAMRLGFNWKQGPFELMDKLGVKWLVRQLTLAKRPVPPLLKQAEGAGGFYRKGESGTEHLTVAGTYEKITRPAGVMLLADIKQTSKPLLKNGSASLWNIGQGVACFEITSKMNTFDPDVFKLLNQTIDLLEQEWRTYKGLVIYSDADNFSAGANLALAMFAINLAHWPLLENFIAEGQKTFRRLRFAPFPSVAATSGLALGGGCEITLNCSAVQAHAETYMGLVEVGVGIIPGWGGCVQMLRRAMAKPRFGGPIPPLAEVFELISTAKTSRSAHEAQKLGYLQPSDGITMNRDRLLFDARAKVLTLAEKYTPPAEASLRLPGGAGQAALQLALQTFALQGKATPHDVVVCTALGRVLSGGETSLLQTKTEGELLELERAQFMTLLKTPATWDRINHMLNTGKPLRN